MNTTEGTARDWFEPDPHQPEPKPTEPTPVYDEAVKASRKGGERK